MDIKPGKLAYVSIFLVVSLSFASAQEIEESQSPDVTITDQRVTTTVYLENTGQDMEEKWILEQQPVNQDNAFSFLSFVGGEQTCDPDNPQNVHKDFRLDSGEGESIKLQSRDLAAGTYDIKLLSVTGCSTGPTQEENVLAKDPYRWGEVVETVDVDPRTAEIQEYREPTLSTNDETGEVKGTVFLENVGDADMDQQFIVEMQILDSQGNLLSTVGEQETCDPNSPENVHKDFSIDSNEKQAISLESNVPETGVYDIKFVTATECMNDGTGIFTQPYISGQSAFVFDNVAVSTGDVEPPKPSPIQSNLVIVLAGVLVIIGGGLVFYRRDSLG